MAAPMDLDTAATQADRVTTAASTNSEATVGPSGLDTMATPDRSETNMEDDLEPKREHEGKQSLHETQETARFTGQEAIATSPPDPERFLYYLEDMISKMKPGLEIYSEDMKAHNEKIETRLKDLKTWEDFKADLEGCAREIRTKKSEDPMTKEKLHDVYVRWAKEKRMENLNDPVIGSAFRIMDIMDAVFMQTSESETKNAAHTDVSDPIDSDPQSFKAGDASMIEAHAASKSGPAILNKTDNPQSPKQDKGKEPERALEALHIED